MNQQYNTYQLRALQQLADFRHIFYDEGKNVRTDLLPRSISFFVELFCQNHFADSDYTNIQKRPKKFTTTDEWINESDIDIILKFLTYYIWTNKSHDGYLIRKIKDKTVYKFLDRLNKILSEQNTQKIQNGNLFIFNSSPQQNNYKH